MKAEKPFSRYDNNSEILQEGQFKFMQQLFGRKAGICGLHNEVTPGARKGQSIGVIQSKINCGQRAVDQHFIEVDNIHEGKVFASVISLMKLLNIPGNVSHEFQKNLAIMLPAFAENIKRRKFSGQNKL